MRWLSALAMLAWLALAACSTPPPAGDAFIRDGDAYRDAYLYTAAVDQYQQALAGRPDDWTALLRLCDVLLRLQRVEDAAAYAESAAEAGADAAALAECRARVADGRGQYAEAVRQWSTVARLRPVDRPARRHLLEAQVAAHDWAAASATAGEILEADPADPTAAYTLAALLALDDPTLARSYLDRTDAPAAQALALALDEEASLGNRAYRAVSIGRVFLDFDNLPLAWRAFADAAAGSPTYPDAFAYLGTVYDRLGDPQLAAAFLDRAIELNPDSVVGRYLRGVFHMQRGEWEAARVDAERAVQLDPASAPAAFAWGQVLAESGDLAAAEEQFDRAAALEPDRAVWALGLAEFHIGRLIRVADAGVPAARHAVDLAPNDALARSWLGWGLHLIGDDVEAEAELREAVRLDPTLARARLHLGNLLIDAGRIEDGRTELQRAVDLDPRGEVGARARQLLGQP